MEETFRLKKSRKYLGMALAVGYFAATVAYSSIFFLADPAKHGFHGKYSAVIMGSIGCSLFGFMFLGSLCLWASYYVEHVKISGTQLEIRTLLHHHRFDVAEIQHLTWRSRPIGGSILVNAFSSKVRLSLSGFANNDRLRIIEILHELVPISLQEGWPEFCYRVALPLRDGRRPAPREPLSKCVLVTRRRYDVMLAFALPFSIAFDFVGRNWLNRGQLLVFPLVVIAAWLLLRFNVPPEGRIETRVTSTSQGRATLLGYFVIISAYFALMVLAVCGVTKEIACTIVCIYLVILSPPMLYLLHKATKEQQLADEQGIAAAPQQWLAQASSADEEEAAAQVPTNLPRSRLA